MTTSGNDEVRTHKAGLRKSIRTMLVEVLSIVVGVLIALAVDQWNQNRQNRQDADEALIKIKLELGTNIDLLELIHKNNMTVYEQIGGDQISGESNGGFVPGLQLQDTAWRTLTNTGIANYVDYEMLYAISGVYSIQEIYKSYGLQLIEADMNISVMRAALNPSADNDDLLDELAPRLGFLLQVEEQLLVSYKTLIEEMDG